MRHDETLRDEHIPLISPQTVSTIIMGVTGVVLGLLWHLALVITSDGLGVGDVHASLDALLSGHPLKTDMTTRQPSVVAAVSVWMALMALALVVIFGSWYRWLSRPSHRSTGKGMATSEEVKEAMGEKRAREKAKQTRPGLSSKAAAKAQLEEVGLVLGTAVPSGVPIVASLEDFVMVKAPTGGGKTTTLLTRAALNAPGACLVTSLKPDILDTIYERRSTKGKVHVFDPLGLASWPNELRWNPVAGCARSRVASQRGAAFADGLGSGVGAELVGGSHNFFVDLATEMLTYLLHAADLAGRDMGAVLEWGMSITETNAAEPVSIIENSTHPWANKQYARLLSSLATGADETVSSTRMSFQRLIRPLVDTEVLHSVTPDRDEAQFDIESFVRSNDTLVILSDNSSTVKAGALASMLFNEVIQTAKKYAAVCPGSRIDPPLRVVADELPNIAPLRSFPTYSSTVRGAGIQLITAQQDDTQGERCWGAAGTQELMSNMAFEVVYPGIKSLPTLERASKLVGKARVTKVRTNYDGTSYITGASEDEKLEDVMRPEQIKNMADGTALVLARNSSATVVKLQPWYLAPDARELSAATSRTEAIRRAHADEVDATTRRIEMEYGRG